MSSKSEEVVKGVVQNKTRPTYRTHMEKDDNLCLTNIIFYLI